MECGKVFHVKQFAGVLAMAEKKNPGQVSAYLDDWTLGQVHAYAKANDRSISWVVGFAVKQFFVAQQPMAIDEKLDLIHGKQIDFVGSTGDSKHVSSLAGAVAAPVKRGPVKKASKHK
jgi:hypothetical protein